MNTKYVVVYLDTSSCYYEGDPPEIVVDGIYSSKKEAETARNDIHKHGFWNVTIIEVPA